MPTKVHGENFQIFEEKKTHDKRYVKMDGTFNA